MPATTPEDTDRLFGEFVNAGDLEALVALYEPEAALVRADRTAAHGTAAIRAELGALTALAPRIRMHVVATFRAGDVAMLHNDWSLTLRAPDGSETALAGKAIEVVRRQRDGTWRFVLDDPYARG